MPLTPAVLQAMRTKYQQLKAGGANGGTQNLGEALAPAPAAPTANAPKLAASPDVIAAMKKKYQTIQQNKDMSNPNAFGGYGDTVMNAVKGGFKGELSTLSGVINLGAKALGQTGGRVVNAIEGKGFKNENLALPNSIKEGTQENKALTTPVGAAQNAGYWAEQLGEFLLPAGEAGKAEKGIDKAVSATEKLGKTGKAVTKIVGKAGVEAGAGAGVTAAQTGGDPKQVAESAATFGLLKGATGAGGEALKAIGLPEHLYSQVFKTSASDMLKELKSTSIKTIQEQNPELFDKFVKSGVVKVGTDGTYKVDESLAKQALDKGLKGSISNMSNTVVKNTLQNETDAQEIASKTKENVKIPSPKRLISVLQQTADDYKDVARGGTARKAGSFIAALKKGNGEIDAKTSLHLRRFLDGMRFNASYNPNAKLSTGQENFKYWSDLVRNKIGRIPGMKNVMSDYTFNIKALDALAKTAAKRGNAQIVNMMDTLIFEGGMQEGMPGLGAAMGIGRKLLTSPGASTGLGNMIEKSGSLSKKGALLKGAASKAVGGLDSALSPTGGASPQGMQQ